MTSRRFWARALVLGAGAAAACGLAEGALRTLGLPRLNPFVAGFSGRAAFDGGRGSYEYHCNRETLRSGELDRPRTARRRLVVLGDSNAWGTGVDDAERVGDRLAAELSQAGLATEVLTLAWPATTYRDFREQYRRARTLDPSLVLVVGTAGNDFVEALHPPSLPRTWDPLVAAGPLAWLRQFHLYHLLAMAGRRPAPPTGRVGDDRCAVERANPMVNAYTQAAYQACALADGPARERALRTTRADAAALHRAIVADGVPTLAVEVPSRLRTPCAGDAFAAQVLAWRGVALGRAVELEENLVSGMRSDASSLDLLDPLPVLAPRCSETYLARDWHLAEAGHRALAAFLLPLAERKLRQSPR